VSTVSQVIAAVGIVLAIAIGSSFRDRSLAIDKITIHRNIADAFRALSLARPLKADRPPNRDSRMTAVALTAI